MTENEVYLKCVKEGSKLRIKIISNGYFNNANCRFPRDLREEGRIYSVSSRNVNLIKTSNGTYFYSISKPIQIVFEYEEELIRPIKVFESEDEPNCIICLDNNKEKICVPCGHYCMCINCISQLSNPKKCPLCRTIINTTILPSDL